MAPNTWSKSCCGRLFFSSLSRKYSFAQYVSAFIYTSEFLEITWFCKPYNSIFRTTFYT